MLPARIVPKVVIVVIKEKHINNIDIEIPNIEFLINLLVLSKYFKNGSIINIEDKDPNKHKIQYKLSLIFVDLKIGNK